MAEPGLHDDEAAELADLVGRAVAGDGDATGQIVQRCRPLVAAVARHHLANPSDVDDVVQDVWLALVQHLPRIANPWALRAWLVTVTMHTAWRVRRRGRQHVPTPHADERPADDDTEALGLAALCKAETHRGLNRALGRLRACDRRLLEALVATDHPDYRAVSRLIDRPVGSIGPTRQRVLRRLRSDPSILALSSDER